MALWDLLTALCLVLPIAGGLATVKDLHRGWHGYAVSILISVAIGMFCAWIMRATARRVAVSSAPNGIPVGPSRLRVLYCLAILWILVALFAGNRVSEAALRIF
jgi:hypothetical protein